MLASQLSCTTRISTFLGHGSENTDIGPVVIVLASGIVGLSLIYTATDATIARSELGGRVSHAGEHDVRQLLLAQALICRVED